MENVCAHARWCEWHCKRRGTPVSCCRWGTRLSLVRVLVVGNVFARCPTRCGAGGPLRLAALVVPSHVVRP